MLFKNSFLKKKKFSSNGSRYSKYFYFKIKLNSLNLKNGLNRLSFYQTSKSGRNVFGKRIIRTRSKKIIFLKSFKINYNLRYLKFGSIIAFKFIPFKNKLLSLVAFSNGALSLFLSTSSNYLFQFWGYYFLKYKKIKKLKLLKNLFIFNFLGQIKKLSFVSCLQILPTKNAQYVRSSGVKAKILKFDTETHTVLLLLPSKIKKIFSEYSVCFYNPISLQENKQYTNGKAGYWRSFGLKPVVRGVAMNAVDHPHGGRTKSIKYPRTPWGKTTKFK